MTSVSRSSDRPAATTSVNWKRLWAGGIATALVAALAGVVVFLAVEGPLDIPVITPPHSPWESGVATVAGYAVAAALLATALLHLLLLSTPRASAFFSWTCILATAAAALWPFSVEATNDSRIGSGAIYLAIGVAIVALLSGVGAATQTVRR